jgi:RNA polymerase sigma-70 factor (ECF subfamily)
MNDNELAAAFQDGDKEAFAALVDRFQERLYRLAYRITRDPEDALDVTQDAFVKVYHRIESWDRRAAFYSWTYRITSNLSIDLVRKRGRDRKVRDHIIREQGDELGIAAKDADPLAQEDQGRLLDKIREAIDALPPGQRAIVALRHYESLTLKEIAEIRGCAVGTVKSTLHQAFRKLRDLLKSEHEKLLPA